jgi:hypothetical protein
VVRNYQCSAVSTTNSRKFKYLKQKTESLNVVCPISCVASRKPRLENCSLDYVKSLGRTWCNHNIPSFYPDV